MSWGASSRWTWVQVFGFQFWVPVFGYQIMCEFRCLYGFVWVKMLELVHARDCFDTFSDETTRYRTKMIKQQSKLCFAQLFVFSVWLMLFLVLHWHRWWSLWLWKSCRGWIAGFRGRRISTLGHWSFAASEAPIGWVPNDEMSVGTVVWNDGMNLSI